MRLIASTQDSAWPLALQAPSLRSSDADTMDRAALRRWISIAAHRNPNTLRSYSGEVSRFWCFLHLVHAASPHRLQETLLRDATEADVAAYESILLGKAPERIWCQLYAEASLLEFCGLKRQPFVQRHASEDGVTLFTPIALKPASVNQALNILHALYAFWMVPDAQSRQSYVGANPVRRLKRATVRAQRQTGRLFPQDALHAMMLVCDEMDGAAKTQADKMMAARRRWLLCLLFGLWARRAEIASLQMKDFFFDGKGWRVRLLRKGNREQELPVAGWIMDALMSYRASMGISGFPEPQEDWPALLALRSSQEDSGHLDPSTLYRDVVAVARQAAQRVRESSLLEALSVWQREHTAKALEALSPHWFRHTAASMAIESGALSLENASRVLGHSSSVVTAAMYYHPDDKRVADGLQKMGAMMQAQPA